MSCAYWLAAWFAVDAVAADLELLLLDGVGDVLLGLLDRDRVRCCV